MDNKVVKGLRGKIFNHIVTNRSGYKDFSASQKIGFVAEAFENANALCCQLWGTNPELNHFWYMYGEASNAIAETIGKSSFIAFSIKTAMNVKRPETLYRLLFHEMRHLYQQQELYFERDSESMSYYWGDNNTHAAWAASPSEKGANLFAYLELLKIMGGGLLKSGDRMVAAKSFSRLSWLGLKCYADHTLGSVRYRLDNKFPSLKGSSEPLGVGVDEEFGGKTGFVSVQRLSDVMAQNSEIFGVKTRYDQEMHDIIAKDSEDGFQELVDVVLSENQRQAPSIIDSKLIEEGVLKEYNGGHVVQNPLSEEAVAQGVDAVAESLYKLRVATETEQQQFEQ